MNTQNRGVAVGNHRSMPTTILSPAAKVRGIDTRRRVVVGPEARSLVCSGAGEVPAGTASTISIVIPPKGGALCPETKKEANKNQQLLNMNKELKQKPIKPLGTKAYGSIPHLPGSRRGPADKGLSDQQAKILTEKARDNHDVIYVQEKLDGSNVSVANIDGKITPLIRAGYLANGSNYKQHHVFHEWAMLREDLFQRLLKPGERCIGEWLMEAHGTRYNLFHEPFVVFDIMKGDKRETVENLTERCGECDLIIPHLIHCGGAISIADVLEKLEPSHHGAIDPVEGAVWRVERKGTVDFLGKYVRPEKVDGKYLENISGLPPMYNWTPE